MIKPEADPIIKSPFYPHAKLQREIIVLLRFVANKKIITYLFNQHNMTPQSLSSNNE